MWKHARLILECGHVGIVECLEEGQRQGKGGVEVDWNTYGKTKVEEYQSRKSIKVVSSS